MLNKMIGEKFDIKNWDLQKHLAIEKNKIRRIYMDDHLN